MPFEKGRKKTGGRTKGTPNAITASVQGGIAEIVNGNLDRLRADLEAETLTQAKAKAEKALQDGATEAVIERHTSERVMVLTRKEAQQ